MVLVVVVESGKDVVSDGERGQRRRASSWLELSCQY